MTLSNGTNAPRRDKYMLQCQITLKIAVIYEIKYRYNKGLIKFMFEQKRKSVNISKIAEDSYSPSITQE